MAEVEYGRSRVPSKEHPWGMETEEDARIPGSQYFGHLPTTPSPHEGDWRNIIDRGNPTVRVPPSYFESPMHSLGRILRGAR